MNYSRYIFFTSLIASLIEKSSYWDNQELKSSRKFFFFSFQSNDINGFESEHALEFLEKTQKLIREQIRKVHSDQEGGFWPVTSGDVDFITYLNRILSVIKGTINCRRLNSRKWSRFVNQLMTIQSEVSSRPVPKIKAVFFLQETFVWPSFESVYEAFIADSKCDADLVYVPFKHVNREASRDDMEAYRAAGLPVIHCEDYDLANESPDFVFFLKPYDLIPKQFYIDEVERIVKRSVFIPYSVKWVDHANLPLLVKYHFQLPLQEKAWKIFDTPKAIRQDYIDYAKNRDENLETIGHPRFDSIHKFAEIRKNIPERWKSKIKGRKVVLWNTHFINRAEGNADSVWATFETFGEKILSCFLNDKSLMLLWRPHPYFISGLSNSGIMTEKEIKEMVAVIEESENIILDNSSDYRHAFSIADALITDASGLLSEFLEVDKPILYTFNEGQPLFVMERLLSAYYQASTWDGVQEFLKVIKTDKDTKKEARMEAREFLGIDPEENVGKRVKEICINDLIREETAFWQGMH